MTSSSVSPKSINYDKEFVGTIPPDTTLPDKSRILIISKDQSYLTHGIHKYPAKFFPELPRYLIQRYSSPGDTVLDPMCGSGTVLLESQLLQRRAIGIDIDPLAILISRVKTTPLELSSLVSAAASLREMLMYYDSVSEVRIPDFHYRDKWFRPFVLRELAIIKRCIEALFCKYEADIVDFLRVVFSSIIRDVSNADPHCTRTVIRKKQKRKIEASETITKFLESLDDSVDSMNDYVDFLNGNDCLKPQIIATSASETHLSDGSVNLAITSPPYINAVDYPRTHQLEMYWLGYIEEGPLSQMKRRYIGTETVYKDEYSKLQVSGLRTLDPLLEKIFESDPRRAFIVYKFFQDMGSQLAETFRVLAPGGRYCLAIGSNLIRGVPVDSHRILTEIATSKKVGFRLERSFFSGLIRHFIKIPRKERMHGEWVLIFKKPE